MAEIPKAEIVRATGTMVSGAMTPYARGVDVATPLAAASQVLGALGELGQEYKQAEREETWARARTETYRDLVQLSVTVEQQTDPDAVATTWNSGLEDIRSRYGERMAGDGKMLNAWQVYFDDQAVRLGVGVDKVRSQRVVDKGRAGLATTLNTYLEGIPAAKTAEDFDRMMTDGLTAIDRKRQLGIISEVEAVNQSQGFRASFEQGVARRNAESTYNAAIGAGSPEAAQAIIDQHLSGEAHAKTSKAVSTHYAQQREATAREEEERVRQVNRGFLSKAASGKLSVQEVLAAPIPWEKQEHWLAAIKASAKGGEGKAKTDPATWVMVGAKIRAGEITDEEQLLPYVQDGKLTLADMKLRAGDIDKQREAAGKGSKGNVDYFGLGEDLFKRTFKGDDDKLAKLPDFLALLESHVKKESLEGPAIYKKAKELMEPMELTTLQKALDWLPFVNPEKLRYEDELSKPFLDDGDDAAPSAAPADAQREAAMAWLAAHGAPVTAANIQAVIDKGLAGKK
ncbi:MAG: hypothetical protein AB7E47_02410 [Desulfovibrionaceae bacterium]